MDPTTQRLFEGAAGAGGDVLGIEDVFSTWLYTGTGSNSQTITNGIDLAGNGGSIFLANRNRSAVNKFNAFSSSAQNYIEDPRLFTDSSFAGSGASTHINALNSDGFGLAPQTGAFDTNYSGDSYVSWTFRKAEKFFDVVTYTGTGSPRTVAHNLGSVPGCIMVKRTDTTGNWEVYHRSLGATQYIWLNTADAATTSITRWNNTEPTSTVFSLESTASVNASGGTYVAYLFAHDAGGFGDDGTESVVSCGSFNDSSSGEINLGWEPQWILYKPTDVSNNWIIFDNMRGWLLSGNNSMLRPNLADAESLTGGPRPTSSGFTYPAIGQGNYIYIAIRRGPMKTPEDATEVFNSLAVTGSAGTTRTVGFPADLIFSRVRNSTDSNNTYDRLRGFATATSQTGWPVLFTQSTSAEATNYLPFLYNIWNETAVDGNAGSGNSNIHWIFRRAPGFFDVVAYTGTGVARTVNHNLGVAPEFIICKARSSAGYNWPCYQAARGNTEYANLNQTSGFSSLANYWNNTSPTSSVFSLSNYEANISGVTYIAYLFATCPGVSKVGSYTGTGTTLDVDCGFSAGARFLLIKRADSTGDWYVFDTARGFGVGNDAFLTMNTTDADNTGNDFFNALSSGFQIIGDGGGSFNVSGASYIFLAIA